MLTELIQLRGDGSPRNPAEYGGSWNRGGQRPGLQFAQKIPMDYGRRATLPHVMLSELNSVFGDRTQWEMTEALGSYSWAKHRRNLKFKLKIAPGTSRHGPSRAA